MGWQRILRACLPAAPLMHDADDHRQGCHCSGVPSNSRPGLAWPGLAWPVVICIVRQRSGWQQAPNTRIQPISAAPETG